MEKYFDKNGNEVKVQKLPPGPENEEWRFQRFSFDENLGISPLIHKPMPVSDDVMVSRSIYEEIAAQLRDAYKALTVEDKK